MQYDYYVCENTRNGPVRNSAISLVFLLNLLFWVSDIPGARCAVATILICGPIPS